MKVERLCISHSINDLEFRFPVEPLPSQLRIVAAATEAMEKSTVALLESPTGTGKILGSGNVASCQVHDDMIQGAFMGMGFSIQYQMGFPHLSKTVPRLFHYRVLPDDFQS